MRTSIGLLVLLLGGLHAHATSLFDQLRAFNPYWADHRGRLDGEAAKVIDSDAAYVQLHLAEVLHVLAGTPSTQFSGDQLASRQVLIRVLADYAWQGRFPINYHRQQRTPVFIDEHGTYCAVGYLMRYTGNDALAKRIASADNFAWVKDITDPGLPDWQAASGFSLAELKLIQGAYDFYQPDAFLLPDRYEVPQKPEQVVRYFEGRDSEKVWCSGEGSEGELHGRWIQNYSSTQPWIEGYFEHGKRSGRWKEYYKGTDKLCRTEHWRDDKLNGIRTRYDREGKVIETILFRNGQAVVKTNIDEGRGLRWVRTPIDTATVHTEIFTTDGGLVAAGKERIHNPEGLLWFQNIELTALNTYAITARDGAPRPENGVFVPRGRSVTSGSQIPGSHTLVEYRKEGAWVYYKDYLDVAPNEPAVLDRQGVLSLGYVHFGHELFSHLARYEHLDRTVSYDSVHVVYADDRIIDLLGFASAEQDHLQFTYHASSLFHLGYPGAEWHYDRPVILPLKRIARLDQHGDLIGARVEYDRNGLALRTEHFHVPYKKEEDMLFVVD